MSSLPGPKDSWRNSIKSVAVCQSVVGPSISLFTHFCCALFAGLVQLSRAWLCGFFLFNCLAPSRRALSRLHSHLHFGPKRVSGWHATWLARPPHPRPLPHNWSASKAFLNLIKVRLACRRSCCCLLSPVYQSLTPFFRTRSSPLPRRVPTRLSSFPRAHTSVAVIYHYIYIYVYT